MSTNEMIRALLIAYLRGDDLEGATLKVSAICERLERERDEAVQKLAEWQKSGSDGYHTFAELYDHRISLFAALTSFCASRSWRSRKHSDGTSWDGWFVVGIGRDQGAQITYHAPDDAWEAFDHCETLEQAPDFDGHASEDVLNRLLGLSVRLPVFNEPPAPAEPALGEIERLERERDEAVLDRDGICGALIECAKAAGINAAWDECPSEMMQKIVEQRDEARAKLAALAEWSRTFGRELRPGMGVADTYGNGMRFAKEHVFRVVSGSEPPATAEPSEVVVSQLTQADDELADVARAVAGARGRLRAAIDEARQRRGES